MMIFYKQTFFVRRLRRRSAHIFFSYFEQHYTHQKIWCNMRLVFFSSSIQIRKSFNTICL